MKLPLRKIAIWSAILLVVYVITPVVVLRMVMHSLMLSRRDQIARALRDSVSVRLEEFDDKGKIVSQIDLDSEQRAVAMESISGDMTGGLPFTLTMCFVPHHRLITQDAKGLEFTFTICFKCDEAAISGTGQFSMPYKWRSSLRKLFEENGFRLKQID